MTLRTDPQSDLEVAFLTQWRRLAHDLPRPVPHHAFFPGRRWEFDYAFVEHKVAIELEGMRRGTALVVCHNCNTTVRARKDDGSVGKPIPLPGWHQSYQRFMADMEKYNQAAARDWIVLRFTYDDVHGDPFVMVDLIRGVLDRRQARAPKIIGVTAAEMKVLQLTAAGLATPAIAERLGIATATARRHQESLRAEFNAPNRAAAVARAMAWNILKPEDIPWADAQTGLDAP